MQSNLNNSLFKSDINMGFIIYTLYTQDAPFYYIIGINFMCSSMMQMAIPVYQPYTSLPSSDCSSHAALLC